MTASLYVVALLKGAEAEHNGTRHIVERATYHKYGLDLHREFHARLVDATRLARYEGHPTKVVAFKHQFEDEVEFQEFTNSLDPSDSLSAALLTHHGSKVLMEYEETSAVHLESAVHVLVTRSDGDRDHVEMIAGEGEAIRYMGRAIARITTDAVYGHNRIEDNDRATVIQHLVVPATTSIGAALDKATWRPDTSIVRAQFRLNGKRML